MSIESFIGTWVLIGAAWTTGERDWSVDDGMPSVKACIGAPAGDLIEKVGSESRSLSLKRLTPQLIKTPWLNGLTMKAFFKPSSIPLTGT